MPRITNANGLTQYALKVMSLAGWTCWRQNNGGVFDPKSGRFRAGSAKKGVSDIIGYHKQTGRALFIEIKAGKDRLSEGQRLFLSDADAAGCLAFVVRHADDLKKYLPTETK